VKNSVQKSVKHSVKNRVKNRVKNSVKKSMKRRGADALVHDGTQDLHHQSNAVMDSSIGCRGNPTVRKVRSEMFVGFFG
jgi:hypothetical protein